MNRTDVARKMAGVAVAWACLAAAAGSDRATGAPSPRALSRVPFCKDAAKDDDIIIRLVSVTDGKPGAHVWEVEGDRFSAYASLYSPQLRRWLGSLRKGTGIYQEQPSSVHKVWGVYPNERELRDFRSFCTAHGLYFSDFPIG